MKQKISDIKKYIIQPTQTLFEALKAINEASIRIVFIVDKNNVLLGSLSDGDVRRALLNGVSMESVVEPHMNKNPVSYCENTDSTLLEVFIKKHDITYIPILDAKSRLIGIENRELFLNRMSAGHPIVLMVGGLGTRLGPLTKNKPKPLLKVGDKPVLETTIKRFARQGFQKFYLAVNYHADQIKSFFGDGKDFGVDIEYIEESKQMGTAGALSLIDDNIKKPLIVMNGDILTSINFHQLLQYHATRKIMATMCVRDYHVKIPYGVVTAEKNRLISIEEKPSKHCYINAGIYVLNPEALKCVPKDSHYNMPQLFDQLLKEKYELGVFPLEDYWIDIGWHDELQKARDEFSSVFGDEKFAS